MTPYEIPLTPQPQNFLISLAGVTYSMAVRWCEPASAWTIDIRDAEEQPLLTGVSLVTGTDLLGQHKHLGIGGQLVVQSDVELDRVPDFGSLGIAGHLYFLVG